MHKITQIRRTCDACPSQWEGATDDGLYVYIRYRWGYLTVEVGKEKIYGRRVGDAFDGYMDEAELAKRLKGILDFTEVAD